jgi:CheY-like chemotaxis protein
MKILVADDTDSVRYALRMALEYLGHEVVGLAADGQETLQKYETTQPELVVVDVRMPIMDGLTCTSLLAKNHQAKVVVVTAGRTTETQARAAGACGFIEKPFDVFDLDRAIHGAVATA